MQNEHKRRNDLIYQTYNKDNLARRENKQDNDADYWEREHKKREELYRKRKLRERELEIEKARRREEKAAKINAAKNARICIAWSVLVFVLTVLTIYSRGYMLKQTSTLAKLQTEYGELQISNETLIGEYHEKIDYNRIYDIAKNKLNMDDAGETSVKYITRIMQDDVVIYEGKGGEKEKIMAVADGIIDFLFK